MKSDIRSFYTVKRLSILYKVTTLLPSADWRLSLQARAVSMLIGKGIPAGSPRFGRLMGSAKNSVFIGMPV
jgi:hypothetical protein